MSCLNHLVTDISLSFRPGYEEHSGTPEDTENFNLLLDDLRSALDELESQTGIHYGLTAYVISNDIFAMSCDAFLQTFT